MVRILIKVKEKICTKEGISDTKEIEDDMS